MKLPNFLQVSVLLIGTWTAATALGRDDTPIRPEPVPPPGIVIDQSSNWDRMFVGSPELEIMPDGTYVATHDWFGPDWPTGTTCVFQSKDAGQTWGKVAELPDIEHGTLIAMGKTLCMVATMYVPDGPKHRSCAVILRSEDNGQTWTKPLDGKTGLLRGDAQNEYIADVFTPLFCDGKLWIVLERLGPSLNTPRNWASGYQTICASIPLEADWLDVANWTFSNALPWVPRPGSGGWLEGCMAQAPDGEILLLKRLDEIVHGGLAVIVHVSSDGKTISYDPEKDVISMPGGCKKFNIKYDPQSRKYWSLVNWVHPADVDHPDKERVRNTLALVCSDDLRNWEVRCVVLRHEWTKVGFQYVGWRFVGEDLVFVSRTGWEGAQNCHNANYLTFHTVKNFRTLTRENDAVTLRKSTNQETAN